MSADAPAPTWLVILCSFLLFVGICSLAYGVGQDYKHIQHRVTDMCRRG